ncbi:unnamed protein product [Haemonchus placei]|uniref:Reverse transcriptase domain-containing protein n=1 Tax=Haemonchus placei TaxID=6290 RepID=A0A0N4WU27_HAEPC|nr:unnamed protein product [Haemonchus placei]
MQMVVRNNVGRTSIRPYRSPITRLYLDRELYKVRLSLLPNQPYPQNALEAYESIRSFVENAADGCWSIQTDPPRISFRTQTLLSERITLRNNSSSVGRIAYSIICKAARIALLEDIRQRKTITVQKAIERGRSTIEAQRKGVLRKRRLLIKDSTTGDIPSSFEPCPPFCIDESEHALSLLRIGRSPGPDRISAEQLALAKSTIAPLLTELLNGIKQGDPIPEDLTTAHVKLLFKKGDPNNVSNYRPISLISGVLKAVTRAILNRIDKKLEESESPIRVTIQRGIKQGDTLSPKLFNPTLQMVLDFIDWGECGLSIGGRLLSSLDYADDVTLLASSRVMLKKMLQLLSNASTKVGLHIDPEKSKLLTSSKTSRHPICIDGRVFAFVDHALYLGCCFSFPPSSADEIAHRIRCGWNAFRRLQYILCNRKVPLPLTASIRLLYNPDRTLYSKKDGKEDARITLLDRWSCERIRALTKVRDWINEAPRRKLTWARKISEMDENVWARVITTWIPYDYVDRRRRGHSMAR